MSQERKTRWDVQDFDFFTVVAKPKNKIVLEDPSVLIRERQREDELTVQMQKPLESAGSSDSEENLDGVQDAITCLRQEMEPKIKDFPQGKHTFASKPFSHLCKDIFADIGALSMKQQHMMKMLLDVECINKGILHYLFQTGAWSAEEVNSVCNCIFMSISINEDEDVLHEGTASLIEAKLWFPTVDIIFQVFTYWGNALASVTNHNVQQSSHPEVVLEKNFQQILHIIRIKAKQIITHTTDEKQCLLISNLINVLLDVHIINSCADEFRGCLIALIEAIPKHQWNRNKIQMICQPLRGEEHTDNLRFLCTEILTAHPRCEQLGYHLASHTVHKIFGLNWNGERTLDFLDSSFNKLSLHELNIVIFLSFLLIKKDQDAKNVQKVVEWLKEVKLYAKTIKQQASLDYEVFTEHVNRDMNYWRIANF